MATAAMANEAHGHQRNHEVEMRQRAEQAGLVHEIGGDELRNGHHQRREQAETKHG